MLMFMNKIIILKGTLFGILLLCGIDLTWFSDESRGHPVPGKRYL